MRKLDGFVQLDRNLLTLNSELKLEPMEFLLYITILLSCNFANSKCLKKYEMLTGTDELCKLSGLKRTSLIKSLSVLVDKGLIEYEVISENNNPIGKKIKLIKNDLLCNFFGLKVSKKEQDTPVATRHTPLSPHDIPPVATRTLKDNVNNNKVDNNDIYIKTSKKAIKNEENTDNKDQENTFPPSSFYPITISCISSDGVFKQEGIQPIPSCAAPLPFFKKDKTDYKNLIGTNVIIFLNNYIQEKLNVRMYDDIMKTTMRDEGQIFYNAIQSLNKKISEDELKKNLIFIVDILNSNWDKDDKAYFKKYFSTNIVEELKNMCFNDMECNI